MYKSGFVTVIGRPNMGKSTLLNRIIGEKISIISDKAQTTRNRIQMIYTDENMQIVFLDTPGIQMPKNNLGEVMLKISESALKDVDVILFMVDQSEETGKLDAYIMESLKKVDTPVILVINKIDTQEESYVQRLVEKYEGMKRFKEIIPLSALEGQNIDRLLQALEKLLPEGPQYYPEDMITDQPERFIISEIIREKALINLSEEIPHGIMVEMERIEKREGKNLVDVEAVLYVEKKSHKGIVIGKDGAMLKLISAQAREDIQRLLGNKVFLRIWVKVAQNWRKKERQVKSFGYK